MMKSIMKRPKKGNRKVTEISRQSVAVYVTNVINDPTIDVRASVGLDRPGTDGDKPSFY